MGRPKKVVRPIEKSISIPEDLVARVDLKLFSELEGRVPHGAWSRYVQELIRGDLAAVNKVVCPDTCNENCIQGCEQLVPMGKEELSGQ